MKPRLVKGDLLDQPTDVIVNSWNRNIIPWWLLLPQGVAGAIKRRAGLKPFWELGKCGAIPLGGAVLTSAGRLSHKAIIHVAGLSLFWRASPTSIRSSVASAMNIVTARGFASVAFPVIGAGVGGFSEEAALAYMLEAFATIDSPAAVTIVQFAPA